MLRRLDIFGAGDDDPADTLREHDIEAICATVYGTRADEKVWTIVLRTKDVDGAVETLREKFDQRDGFRMFLFEVLGGWPSPEQLADENGEGDEQPVRSERINREELINEVGPGSRITSDYLVQVAISTLLAALGLLRDDVAVIIAAMVIAPLLRPAISLGLGTTLGDWRMQWRSALTLTAGLLLGLGISVALGTVVGLEEMTREIALRTDVGLVTVVLALCAGASGAMAVTSGLSATLVGVMVAVALMPALAACGLLLGAGYVREAGQAGLLLAVNVACVNLTAVVVFLARGLRPSSCFEQERARQAWRWAVVSWTGAVLLLSGLAWWLTTSTGG